MKTLVAGLMLVVLTAGVYAGSWDKVVDGKVVSSTYYAGTTKPKISGIINPTREQIASVLKMYEQLQYGDIPEGHYKTGSTWTGVSVETLRSMWLATVAPIPIEPDPKPDAEALARKALYEALAKEATLSKAVKDAAAAASATVKTNTLTAVTAIER